MRASSPDQELKAQLARELCTILDGYQRDIAAAHVDAHVSELSRLRHGDLRRFSLARIIRYIARAGYDIEVHLKKRPRLEQRQKSSFVCLSRARRSALVFTSHRLNSCGDRA